MKKLNTYQKKIKNKSKSSLRKKQLLWLKLEKHLGKKEHLKREFKTIRNGEKTTTIKTTTNKIRKQLKKSSNGLNKVTLNGQKLNKSHRKLNKRHRKLKKKWTKNGVKSKKLLIRVVQNKKDGILSNNNKLKHKSIKQRIIIRIVKTRIRNKIIPASHKNGKIKNLKNKAAITEAASIKKMDNGREIISNQAMENIKSTVEIKSFDKFLFDFNYLLLNISC